MNSTPRSSDDSVVPFSEAAEEMIAEQWCKLHRLIDELSQIQRRLGTPMEEEEDYANVRRLGHEIRNKLLLLQLWNESGVTASLSPGKIDPATLDRIAFAGTGQAL